jgi:hypothetical protein
LAVPTSLVGAPEDRPGLFDHAQITLTLGAYSHVLSEAGPGRRAASWRVEPHRQDRILITDELQKFWDLEKILCYLLTSMLLDGIVTQAVAGKVRQTSEQMGKRVFCRVM